jgi:hypothetical protein
MADNENKDGIVDLRERVRRREEEEAQKKHQKEVVEKVEDNKRVYEVKLKSGETFQISGVLMLTGAFFALGMPIGDTGAVDFNWASPIDAIDYVIALDDDDLIEDGGSVI